MREYKKTERDVLLVKHILFLENKRCDDTADSCNCRWKPPFRIRQSADIHTIEAEDDVRYRHDDCDDSQYFHYDIQVIGNNRGKSPHHAA